jgi:hypothetical protein
MGEKKGRERGWAKTPKTSPVPTLAFFKSVK